MTNEPSRSQDPSESIGPTDPADPTDLTQLVAHLDQVVVGKGPQLQVVVAAILAGGHVLIEDVPGVGKTLAAKAIAARLGLSFARIQFTPDMLPSDVTGAVYFDQRDREFVFRPGPVFAGLVLADEINRAPAKTQAALLQAMAEQEISVDGTTHALPRPFHVIATANPIEYEGTFPLPEAQLDRFLVRATLGYPDLASELHLVRETARAGVAALSPPPVTSAPAIDLRQAQARLCLVNVSDEVSRYIVDLVAATRDDRSLALGASPRGSLALTQCGQALALLRGRSYVTPADVQDLAVPVLAHRVVLRTELWGSQTDTTRIIRRIVEHTPAPDSWNA